MSNKQRVMFLAIKSFRILFLLALVVISFTIDAHSLRNDSVKYEGLFTVVQESGRYFFDIPDSVIQRDLLVVSRIARGGSSGNSAALYAGDLIGERMVRFVLGHNNNLYIQSLPFNNHSVDSSENGMFKLVMKSNMPAIFEVFPIIPTSGSGVYRIDVSDFLHSNSELLYFDPYKLLPARPTGGANLKKSYISEIRAFPLNIEVKSVKVYEGSSPITHELNTSIRLLPKVPMKIREYDGRIGYLRSSPLVMDFDRNDQGAESVTPIKRFRLEPKDHEWNLYQSGQLVEPKQPIVFYLDPDIPKRWVPYIINGVNAWQTAFEEAGFKNAICAREAPAAHEDSMWSLYDARYNTILWHPTARDNADGSTITDPRTGEILSGHVRWFHNEMIWNRDNYFILASPTDSRARKLQFDETLMGQIIESVICHEVGHTLGLAHNFLSSRLVSVDSLRDKNWVEENGFCTSIMEYARYNYVAQPEDSVGLSGLIRRLGIYDEWAIEWGYRFFPQLKSPKDEKVFLNKWVIDRLIDKRLHFSEDERREDLGDDVAKANTYGIRNLQRVMENLIEWTAQPNEDYAALEVIYKKIVDKYRQYIQHLAQDIGGYTTVYKKQDEEGDCFQFKSRIEQQNALAFLHEQLFNTPHWLMDTVVFKKIGNTSYSGPGGFFSVLAIQEEVLKKLLSIQTLNNLLVYETTIPDAAYSRTEFLEDISTGIWSEITTNRPVDLYRRNLQRAYVNQLVSLITAFNEAQKADPHYVSNMEAMQTLENHASQLLAMMNKSSVKDENTQFHLNKLTQLLDRALSL